jgi:hypothetical protein
MVDDDGAADPGNCDGAGEAFLSVQGAVDSMASGANIDVCPGTYTEQLSIPASKDNVTLRSTQSRAATIKAPATMAEPGDILRVDGASNLTLRGFVISGPLPNALFCSTETRAGVFVANGGSVTIDDNQLTGIRAADPNLRGCQNGIAVRVGRQATSSFGTATITNNDFDTYQKGAIVVDGSGSNASVTQNEVTGEGPVNYIAQNGIQISRGATGNVAANVVQDHTYSSAPSASSSGILLFESGAGLVVNNNDVHDNDDNIPLFTVSGVVVQQNAARDSTFYDGFFADSDTSGNQFLQNFASGNQLLDCEDLSTGTGTAGTANTWENNTGTTSVPPLICTPPFGGPPAAQGSDTQARAQATAHRAQPAG